MGRLTKKIANKNEQIIEETEIEENASSPKVGLRLLVAIIIVFLIVSMAFYGLAL